MNKKKYDLQDVFFQIGKWCAIPVVIIGIWFSRIGYHYTKQITQCRFRERTGLPCAGCGGTRALILLFRGEFLRSFCYHPAVLTAVILYIHFMLYYIYRKRWSHKEYRREINVAVYAYILAGMILLQWMVKWILIFYMVK